LSRTVGWFTTKYPVSLTVGGLDWAQVRAGEAVLGAVLKQVKEQLRALPDAWTYGVLRYLNPEVDLDGVDPPIGFNYLGRLGATADETGAVGEGWRLCEEGVPAQWRRSRCRWPTASSSTPPPSTPTPARTCTPTGPGRPRPSTMTKSAN
jgi:hypothetical protein